MRFFRTLFCLICLLAIAEVTNMPALFGQNILISADWMETPGEEDESREIEEEEDIFLEAYIYARPGSVSFTKSTMDAAADLKEPLYSIIVPPPQG